MPSVLFVCLGNICRSPAAQGILLHLYQESPKNFDLIVESCGLGDWHKGKLPDERMRRAAKARGIILASQARGFKSDFFDKFDYILAADNKVLFELYKYAEFPEQKSKIHLITKYSTQFKNQEIPDPFYGVDAHFEQVLNMLEEACKGILDHLCESHTS